jgi:putative transposase
MQYFGLHKSIYKLKKLIIPEQNFIPAISEIREKVKRWEKLNAYKVPDKEIASVTGMNRASFYRHKKSISIYGLKGLERRSKSPKRLRSSKIPVSIIELILKLRQENPIYGKAKITVLLRRDHGVLLSESSVGRILKNLMTKGKILRSVLPNQKKA